MCEIILCHKNDSGSFLVQPVHNSRTQRIATSRKRLPPSQQRIHQRSSHIPRPGVHRHPRGFVHHDPVVVFIENVEWNRFRLCAHRQTILRIYSDLLAAVQTMRALRRLPVDEHQPCFD